MSEFRDVHTSLSNSLNAVKQGGMIKILRQSVAPIRRSLLSSTLDCGALPSALLLLELVFEVEEHRQRDQGKYSHREKQTERCAMEPPKKLKKNAPVYPHTSMNAIKKPLCLPPKAIEKTLIGM